MLAEKPTDADVMTGFNPDRSLRAEDIEAREADADVEGAEPEGQTAEPSEVDITLDGQKYRAPRDIAAAFTREINRRDGTRGAELQALRERVARVEVTSRPAPEVQDTGPKLPDPELQIENPAEYQRQLLAHIESEQEKRTQALADQYEEAEKTRDGEARRLAAWNEHCDAFYSKPENKVLVENKDIVDLVLEQNRTYLSPLSVEDGFKELGRLAKERLARATGVAPEVRSRRTPKPPTLEGSTARTGADVPAGRDEGPTSLTQALKERRRQAAESFAKGSSGTPLPRR